MNKIFLKQKKCIEQFYESDEFTDSSDVGVVALGLPTPGSPRIKPPQELITQKWDYFITVAFPVRGMFKIKHIELTVTRPKIVFSDIRYGDCTQNEQYEWLMWILRRHINQIADYYDIFFEQTKEGNLHFHGRLRTAQSSKNVKSLLFRMFGVNTKCTHFVDIKEYDPQRWSDYDKKTTKSYQTLNYEHFKNI